MMQVLTWLASTGADLARWMVWMTIWSAVLLTIVFVLDRALARRVTAAWRIALYAVIAVRLVLPLGWTAPVGVLGASSGSVAATPPTQAVPYLSDIPIVGHMFRAPPAPSRPQLVPVDHFTFTMFVLVVPIYATGVTVLGVVLGLRLRAAHRLVRQSRPLNDHTAAIRVHVHPIAGPVLVGILSPTLVVPEALARPEAAEDLRVVLAHERAHVRRADPLLAGVLAVATVVLWPLIAVWIAAARVRGLMEQAADELAVGGADARARTVYAETLLRVATNARRATGVTRLAPAPALGFADGLESRVRALANTRRWSGLYQGGVVVTACAALIACAGSRAASAEEPETPAALREAQVKSRADGARIIRLTVLPGVPRHDLVPPLEMQQEQERLDAQPREQVDVDLDAKPRPISTWSADEARSVIRAAGEQGVPPMASPTMQVMPGEEGSLVISENFPDGDFKRVANGVIVRVRVSKAANGVPPNAAGVSVEFTERKDGRDYTWTWYGPVVIPHGRTAYAYAPGEKGAPVRMLLISAEAASPDDGVNPMDPAAFPYVSSMIWMMELKEPVSFGQLLPGALKGECSGTAQFAGESGVTQVVVSGKPSALAGAWASMVPAGRLNELGDNLVKAGAKHIASPVLIGKPQKPLPLAAGSLDKAQSSTGPYGVTLTTRAAKGDATVLEGVQTVALVDGSSRRMCSFEGVRVEPGDALAILQPPAGPGGAWLLTVYTPEYIASQEKYPFQQSTQVDPPPEVEKQVKKAPQEQTAAPPLPPKR